MSDGGPFRELFVEVPLALLEAAVLEREAKEERRRQLAVMAEAARDYERWHNTEACLKYFCDRFGLKFRHMLRDAWRQEALLDVYLECGHKGVFLLDERPVIADRVEDVIDYLFRTLQGIPERKCSCVLKERL